MLSSFFGALVVFAWSSISWMLLGWHQAGHRSFTDEAAVAAALVANAPASGIYMLPNPYVASSSEVPTPAGGEAPSVEEKLRAGPFLYAAVRIGRRDWNMAAMMGESFATQLVGAFLLSALLGAVRIESYGGRVIACMLAGLFAGVVGHVPNATWWEFPWNAALVNIADLTVSWFLGGLVIARLTSPVRYHSSSWVR